MGALRGLRGQMGNLRGFLKVFESGSALLQGFEKAERC